jgi:hypothetical protein
MVKDASSGFFDSPLLLLSLVLAQDGQYSGVVRGSTLRQAQRVPGAPVLPERCKEFWPAEKLANSRLPEKMNDELFRALFWAKSKLKYDGRALPKIERNCFSGVGMNGGESGRKTLPWIATKQSAISIQQSAKTKSNSNGKSKSKTNSEGLRQ